MDTHSTPLPVALITNADNERSANLVIDLLDAGYRVVLTGHNAAALAHTMHGLDDRVYAIAADLTDPWQLDRLRTRVIDRFGRLDEVINADTGEVLPLPGRQPAA